LLQGEDTTATEQPFTDAVGESSCLAWLQQAFGLSPFDTDLIVIALAPELDLRYERLYAYLQDDVSKKRPSIDLALNLLCASPAAKLTRREHFATHAPLIRHGLIHLLPDAAHQSQPPLLAHILKLDDQIVNFMLGQETLDCRLAPFCRMVTPTVALEALFLQAETIQALQGLVTQARAWPRPLRLYFQGACGSEKARTAEALAYEAAMPLLTVDVARALTAPLDFEQLLKLALRQAWFQDAMVYLDGLDVLRSNERVIAYHGLLDALAEDGGMTILSGSLPWAPSGREPIGVLSVDFSMPNFPQRRSGWQISLDATGVSLNAPDLNTLADRFRLTPEQIREAAVSAHNRAR
jgi:hypothetical protein